MRKHLLHIGLYTGRTALLTAAGTIILGAFAFGLNNPTVARILPELIALVISMSVIAVVVRQTLIREAELPCMSGMMIGMTVGMLSGFLVGYLVGATNGMFIGSLAGVIVGSGIGARAGNCSGIMGVMEGLMAGLMAGTMGAMLSVMMLSDHYRIFSVLFVVACIGIFAALSMMIEREFTAMRLPAVRDLIHKNQTFFIFTTIVISVIIMMVMVYGPRGPLTVLAGIL